MKLNFNKIGGIDVMVNMLIALFIVAAVFIALWEPTGGDGLREILLNLTNSSGVRSTFGTGIAGALTYAVDFTPIGAALVAISAVVAAVKTAMTIRKV